MDNNIEKEIYIEKIAKEYNISKEAIYAEVNKLAYAGNKSEKVLERTKPVMMHKKVEEKEIPPTIKKRENTVISILLTGDINIFQVLRQNIQVEDFKDKINQKIAQIKELKYVSRDEEKNQFLFARAERLYQESLGEEREVVMRNRQWLDSVINGKNQAAIHAAQKQVGQVFDYLEEKLGLGEL